MNNKLRFIVFILMLGHLMGNAQQYLLTRPLNGSSGTLIPSTDLVTSWTTITGKPSVSNQVWYGAGLQTSTFAFDGTTLTAPNVTASANMNAVNFLGSNLVRAGVSGSMGYSQLNKGDATYSGYLEIFTPNGSRAGYMGYAPNGGPIQIYSDNAAGFNFMNGRVDMGLNKITGLGDATLATDAMNRQSGDGRYGQLTANNTWSGIQTVNNAVNINSNAVLQFNSKNSWKTQSTTQIGDNLLGWNIDGNKLLLDEEFSIGLNGMGIYNNNGGTALTLVRSNTAISGVPIPNSTGFYLKVQVDNSSLGTSPNWGGIVPNIPSINLIANKIYIQRFRALLPIGYSFDLASNAIGTNGTHYWLSSQAGTGKWEEYVRVVKAGDSGAFSSSFHVYVFGTPTPTVAAPLVWYIASHTVIEASNLNQIASQIGSFPTLKGADGNVGTTGQIAINNGGGWNWTTPTFASAASIAGTTNYLAKFTSAGAVGNSLMFDNGTNVGIGSTAPITKFQVDKSTQTIGATTPQGALLITDIAGSNLGLELGTNTANGNWIQSRNVTSQTYYNLSLNPSGGNVLIGSTTDNTINRLQVTGSVYSSTGFFTTSQSVGVTGDGSSLYLKAVGNTYLNSANNALVTNSGGLQATSIISSGLVRGVTVDNFLSGTGYVNLQRGTTTYGGLLEMFRANGTRSGYIGFAQTGIGNDYAAEGVTTGNVAHNFFGGIMSLNNQRITNVAAAVNSADVVIKSQLDAVSAGYIIPNTRIAYGNGTGLTSSANLTFDGNNLAVSGEIKSGSSLTTTASIELFRTNTAINSSYNVFLSAPNSPVVNIGYGLSYTGERAGTVDFANGWYQWAIPAANQMQFGRIAQAAGTAFTSANESPIFTIGSGENISHTDLRLPNSTYLRSNLLAGNNTRILGINSANILYLGGIDQTLSNIVVTNSGTTLFTYGNSGNTSNVTLNMNGTKITNGAVATASTDFVIKSQLDAAITGGISGTTNQIPIFTSTNSIGNSAMSWFNSNGLTFNGNRATPHYIYARGATDDASLKLRAGSTVGYYSEISIDGWDGTGTPSNINFRTAGVDVARFNNSGNLSIGSTSDFGAKLGIEKLSTYNTESSAGIYVRSGAGATNTGLLIGTDKASNIAYIQSIEPATSYGTKSLILNPNGGLVGIGLITPLADFHVKSAEARFGGIGGSYISLYNASTRSGYIQANSGTDFRIASETDPMAFWVGGAERARLNSSGQFAINLNNPTANFSVAGTMEYSPTSAKTDRWATYTGGAGLIYSGTTTATDIGFIANGGEKFRLLQNGTVKNFGGAYQTQFDNERNIYRDVLFNSNNNPTVTGAFVIETPLIANAMVTITIKGYDYSAQGGWSATVAGYTYAPLATDSWYNYKGEIEGVAPFKTVTLGYNTSNSKYVIILGGIGTTWNYPKIEITEVIVGFSNNHQNYNTGWSGSFVTTLAAYGNQRAVNLQKQMNGYGIGTYTATPTRMLGVDGTGNVVETNPVTSNISGTANYIPMFSSANIIGNSGIFQSNAFLWGFGTASPIGVYGATAHITSSTGGSVNLGGTTVKGYLAMSDGLGNGVIGTSTNHPFSIITNGVEISRYFTNGNVLIGTTAIDNGNSLQVIKAGTSTFISTNATTNGSFATPAQSGLKMLGYSGELARIAGLDYAANFSYSGLAFSTLNASSVLTERARFSGANGDLVFNNDQTVQLLRGVANGGAIRLRSNSGAATDRDLQLGNTDNSGIFSHAMSVTNALNVTIGTTTDNTINKLQVTGSAYSTGGFFTTAQTVGMTGDGTSLYLKSGGTTFLNSGNTAYILSNGNGRLTDLTVKSSTSTDGYVQLVFGTATNSGYINFMTPNQSRAAYFGNAINGGAIEMYFDNGVGLNFINGRVSMGSQKIINLANGTAGTDAVNLNQLNSATTGAVAGTTNFIPKFTGINSIGNSRMNDDGTNININTTATNATILFQGTNAQNLFRIANNTVSGSYNPIVTTDDIALVYGLSSNATRGLSIVPHTGTAGGIRMDAAGKVGFNMSSPQRSIDAIGDVYIRKTIGSNDVSANQHNTQFEIRQATGEKSMSFGVYDDGRGVIQVKEAGVGYNNLLLNPVSGNVGVGTGATALTYKMQVAGTLSSTYLDAFGGLSTMYGLQIGNATGDNNLHIGQGNGATGNRYAYIDFIGDNTYTDYGLRIIRNNTGANANSQIVHRGLGFLELNTNEAAPINFVTNATTRAVIQANGVTQFNSAITQKSGSGVAKSDYVFSFDDGAASKTGTLVLEMPTGWNNTMGTYEIEGFNYSGTTSGYWKLIVSGYNYTDGGSNKFWTSQSAQSIGNPPFSNVRLGFNATTGKNVIMLGTTTTSWAYPKLYVSAMTSHSYADYMNIGWSASWVTTETAYSALQTVTPSHNLLGNTTTNNLYTNTLDIKSQGYGLFYNIDNTNFSGIRNTGATGAANSNLDFFVGGNTVSRILPSGNWGIGTVSPIFKLHVTSSGSIATYTGTGNGNNGLLMGVAADGTNQILNYAGKGLVFGGNFNTTQTEQMRLDAFGQLGVGNSAPRSTLDVTSTTGNGIISIDGLSSSTNGILFYRSAVEAGRITFPASGIMTFTIGGAIPLQLNSSNLAQFAGNINIGNVTTTGISSDGTSLYLRSGGTTYLNTGNTAVVASNGSISGRDFQASRLDGTGVYYFGGTSNRYLYYDGTTYRFNQAPLDLNSQKITGLANGTAGTDAVNKSQLDAVSANVNGTTNYVAKFTGANAIGNSLLFDNGTNVVIGATASTFKFGTNSTIANIAEFQYFDGTNNPRLQIIGSTNGIMLSETYSTVANNLMFGIAGVEAMRINNLGNVGIGTASPDSRLDVIAASTAARFRVGYLSTGENYLDGTSFTVRTAGGTQLAKFTSTNFISNQPLSMTSQKITDVANGVSGQDAVNMNQLTNINGTWITAGTVPDARLSTTISQQAGNWGQLDAHGTFVDYNAVSRIGGSFVQGAPATNAPSWIGSSGNQGYQQIQSLGSNYPFSGSTASDFAQQTVIGRNSSTPYFGVRWKEAGVWSSWTKIWAGFADNATTANTLTTSRNINGTSFNGSTDILTTEWVHSSRDFTNGTLITTNINYAVSDGDAFLLEIKGNSYGNVRPVDIKVQGYIYGGSMINVGGTSAGTNITGMVAINNGGNLCFWFPNQGYWQGYAVNCMAVTGAGRNTNRVTSITDVAKPTTAKEVAISASIVQSIHSQNYPSQINLSNLTTGTLADARLSTNVALDNINNNFSTTQTINGSGDTPLSLNKPSGTEWNYADFRYSGTRRAYFGVESGANFIIGVDGTNKGIILSTTGTGITNMTGGANVSGALTVGGSTTISSDIFMNNATAPLMAFTSAGVNAPTFTTRSAGTKIVLYPNITSANVDYALGIDASTLWSSVPTSGAQFKWYAGTTNVATLSGTGILTLSGVAIAADATAATHLMNRQSADARYLQASGTTNYVPKFTAANTIGISSIFDNGSGVGFNTTNIKAALNSKGVASNALTSGTTVAANVMLENNSNNSILLMGAQSASPFGNWITSTDKSDLSINYPLQLQPFNGNVIVGGYSDNGAKLQVNGDAFHAGKISAGGAINTSFALTVTGASLLSGNVTGNGTITGTKLYSSAASTNTTSSTVAVFNGTEIQSMAATDLPISSYQAITLSAATADVGGGVLKHLLTVDCSNSYRKVFKVNMTNNSATAGTLITFTNMKPGGEYTIVYYNNSVRDILYDSSAKLEDGSTNFSVRSQAGAFTDRFISNGSVAIKAF